MTHLGAECAVYGFERDHYKGKPWAEEPISLGHIRHGRYLGRIGAVLRSVVLVRRAAESHDVIYSFSLDTLFIGWLGSRFQSTEVKLVHDVADIRHVLVSQGIIPALLRRVERFLLKRTSVVVVASPAFIDGYFRGLQRADNSFFVIENKVESDLLPSTLIPSETEDRNDEVLTIGYFGLIRCEESLRFLKELVTRSDGSIRLSLRGIFLGTESHEGDFGNLEYAHFGGPFVYPDDLGQMYASVDLVWAAHMHGESNTKWSISNRFYQACFFHRPLIAQASTQDARRVEQYSIGCVIDLRDISASMDAIRAISKTEIGEWTRNMRDMPRDVYTFTDEHHRLVQEIEAVGR